ncbi:MAG: alpha/beta hydrolase [Candidatus Heimdallarchaeota archaeon]|nr:alpha/beta hydrolase [Candidatus Heimdallarchaeota archaeon]
MEDISVFDEENDPYSQEDLGSDKFLDPNTWRRYFDDSANITLTYIEVEEGVKTMLIKSTPQVNESKRAVLIIPGWFSMIVGWNDVLLNLSKNTIIYFWDTREHTTSPHERKDIDYSIPRIADDFSVLIQYLEHKIEDMIVVSSSLSGTILFNYLARYERWPYQTLMIGPNPRISTPPILPFIFLHVPLIFFKLAIKYIKWHIMKFLIDSNQPGQGYKFLQVMRLAQPARIRASARKVLKYNAWEGDIAKIDAPIILIASRIDKMHGAERTMKIHNALKNSCIKYFESNLDAHSAKMGEFIFQVANDQTTELIWD